MAEKDIAEKTFMSLNDVFADVFNGLLFQGEQVIAEDTLEDSRVISQYKAEDDSLHEQERDTFKLWKGHGINLVLIGVENQTNPDKDMPFRVISYDGAAYRSQLLKTEEKEVNGEIKKVPVKERYPVITIVLYFGEAPWNCSKNLKECLEPPLPENEIIKVLDGYIQDYKVHVFDIPRLKEEQVKKFRSDFRIVADYFTHAYTDANYEPDDAVIVHVDEFLKLMKVLTGDNRYEEIAEVVKEKEGEVRMCKVLDAREARGLEQGMKQGLVALINSLKQFIPEEEALYQAVIKNEIYKDISRETFKEIV